MTSSDVPQESTVDMEEKEYVNVRLTIHTTSREKFLLDLGKISEGEKDKITALINNGFVIGPSKDWILPSTDGREYHFNTEHVVLVVVELS